ncbi:hypothetical protein [Dankookia sp. P2]|uniref:hypothetical protein n=1 Tax=Dankookia sp. P2 TaxID=3423955 RepID=UPI003D67C26C
MRTLLVLTLLGAAVLAAPFAHAAPPTAQGAAHLVQGTEALHRLAGRLRRLAEDGLDPRDYAIPADALAQSDPGAYAAALRASAAAALSDLLHGRVRDLPGRADLRRDTAALPLGPWMAELGTAAEPAAVIDRAALLPPGPPC